MSVLLDRGMGVEWEMWGVKVVWVMEVVWGMKNVWVKEIVLGMKFLRGMEVARVVGVVWDGDELVHTEQEVQHHAFLLHLCGCIVRHQSEMPPLNEAPNTPYSTKYSMFPFLYFASYLGSRSQPTPISLVSKTSRGLLLCVDIKYFSLSSNSLFWEKEKRKQHCQVRYMQRTVVTSHMKVT